MNCFIDTVFIISCMAFIVYIVMAIYFYIVNFLNPFVLGFTIIFSIIYLLRWFYG